MTRPTDRVCLVLSAPEGYGDGRLRRWWFIQQPVPSVAFALQGRIAAALGGAGDFAVRAFFADPEQEEDLRQDAQTMGEGLALRVLRRARSGRGLCEAHEMADSAARLWAVLRVASERGGGVMDAVSLLGDPERSPAGPRWSRASLLYRLLLESGLRYDGDGQAPLGAPPDGPAQVPNLSGVPPHEAAQALVKAQELQRRVALRDAVQSGSVTAFVSALDDVLVSPDELALLSAWAVVHLVRPF